MDTNQVLSLLSNHQNERGIANFEKLKMGQLRSYGIGLTMLKKMAKEIGRNHELALALWELPVYEALQLSALIDEPKKISREQVNNQVSKLNFWMLSYVFCSTLWGKLSFSQTLTDEWVNSTNDIERRCAYLILYQFAQTNKVLPDAYFLSHLDRIEKDLQKEENFVRDAMNSALLSIGKRNAILRQRTIVAATNIGKVIVDYGDNSCQAPDALKHFNK